VLFTLETLLDGVASEPKGANGFGLPSVPSGVSKILESNKEEKAGLLKIVSFNFMFLTFKRTDKKS
jgi:hypothetical protein